jgi:hypothetical protein
MNVFWKIPRKRAFPLSNFSKKGLFYSLKTSLSSLEKEIVYSSTKYDFFSVRKVDFMS